MPGRWCEGATSDGLRGELGDRKVFLHQEPPVVCTVQAAVCIFEDLCRRRRHARLRFGLVPQPAQVFLLGALWTRILALPHHWCALDWPAALVLDEEGGAR